MSLPPDDIAPFAARRRRLMDHMRAAGGGIAILPTAPQALRNRDAEYPYRHDSDFFYLTGFTEPEAWLVLVAGATDRALLFCRDKHPEHEIWEGFRFGPEAAAAQPALWTPVAASAALDERVRSWLAAARAQGRS
ncbi:aminopeptidase P N-terminal domain-containing protein, partial [Bordetella pertussis]|uniref:aminopeptidase P N-terminal domain-containing protein n=1 Tax=Bordetella pertussis TaxID=520 RepID=UPI000B132E4E